MRSTLAVCFLVLAVPALCHAQVGGNIAFSQTSGRLKAYQAELARRNLATNDLPPSKTSMFVEASVLMNVKADEHVVVFGIAHEGETLAICGQKMDATVQSFTADLKSLGIAGDDVFVDFIAQNRIYGFQLQGDLLQEKLIGFELKKNISIHYKDHAQLDKITLAASKSQIYDLIKVDYVIKDMTRVQDRLMDEAARIVKSKTNRYEKLLGIKLHAPAQVYAEKSGVHYPTQMYDSYSAYESQEIRAFPERTRHTVVNARKSQTFFFNALDADGFDAVIDPVITAPVVQCTLYLKLKYEVEQPAAK
jgi:uncharacterized protein YggE